MSPVFWASFAWSSAQAFLVVLNVVLAVLLVRGIRQTDAARRRYEEVNARVERCIEIRYPGGYWADRLSKRPSVFRPSSMSR